MIKDSDEKCIDCNARPTCLLLQIPERLREKVEFIDLVLHNKPTELFNRVLTTIIDLQRRQESVAILLRVRTDGKRDGWHSENCYYYVLATCHFLSRSQKARSNQAHTITRASITGSPAGLAEQVHKVGDLCRIVGDMKDRTPVYVAPLLFFKKTEEESA